MKNLKSLNELAESNHTDSSRLVQNAYDAVIGLNADGMEKFLFKLSKYFDDTKEELTNMNAEDVSKALRDAAEMVQNRSGN